MPQVYHYVYDSSRWNQRTLLSLIRLCFLTILAAAGLRAQGPENVLLVVNANSQISRQIGDYYAQARKIPSSHVCRIRVTAAEEIPRVLYEKEIETPVSLCLKSRGLTEQVLYLVTTLHVPLRIAATREKGKVGSDAASVDSELTLLYQKMRGAGVDPNGAMVNPFFRQRDTPFQHKAFPIYLVTRLAAYSFEDVRRMIDRSVTARNQGRVIVDLRAAGIEDEGNASLRMAAILLPKDRVVFDDSPVVLRAQHSVIGLASWGSNDKDRKDRLLKMQWLPGALMLEFVSTNARTFQKPPDTWTIGNWSDPTKYFQGAPQTLSADYVMEGASAAGGHVDEPFLHFCARPDLVFPAYLKGRNLAESYWLGVPALSWMNIIIGDPLMKLQ